LVTLAPAIRDRVIPQDVDTEKKVTTRDDRIVNSSDPQLFDSRRVNDPAQKVPSIPTATRCAARVLKLDRVRNSGVGSPHLIPRLVKCQV